MLRPNEKHDWERIGKTNPYFGVITDPKFSLENLTDELKEEFFQSGVDFVNHIIQNTGKFLASSPPFQRALEFGCGVGRLTIPLSSLATEVVAVDVSEAMLNEARKNCRQKSINNVRFSLSDSEPTWLHGAYDFVLSFIVFQHIPEKKGMELFESIVNHVSPGGIVVVHFTYGKLCERVTQKVMAWLPILRYGANLFRGRPLFQPLIQMNAYGLNPIFRCIQTSHVSVCHVEFTDHGGELGIILYFQKDK